MRSSGALRAGLLAAIFCCAAPALAETLEGKVVAITDGDTFKLLVDRAQYDIRIAQVDTPERGWPWAKQAQRALGKLVFGHRVRVEVVGTSHKRLVGEVWLGEVCVGCELIRAGHAWAGDGYVTNRDLYRLEEEARRARLGLWSLPDRVWAQRSKPRGGSTIERLAPSPPTVANLENAPREEAFACSKTKSCREMSCAEARSQLKQCGRAGIDGDGDGRPCETKCP